MNRVVDHNQRFIFGSTRGPRRKCPNGVLSSTPFFKGWNPRFREDKRMDGSTNVAPPNLDEVSPIIAQCERLCHVDSIFPGWGVVAVHQAVDGPLEFSFRRVPSLRNSSAAGDQGQQGNNTK